MTDYSKMTDWAIDSAVGEKVMNWKNFGTNFDGNIIWENDAGKVRSYFHPTTDWNDMRLVVDKLIELGWKPTLTIQPFRDWKHWSASLERSGKTVWKISDTLPRAVCECALKAIKIK